MRVRLGVVVLTVLACAVAGALPGDAVAQQPAPAKSGATVPKPDATPVGDLFMPPLRGTPDGRISGGTRGVGRIPPSSGTQTTTYPPPAQDAQAAGPTRSAVIPVAR